MCESESGVVRAWEECVVVAERGSRVVHYILKDNIGNSVVAVVGRERRMNHMVYTVSDDFLRVFGCAAAGKKWEARRQVVDWLVSLVARGGPIMDNSISRQSKLEHSAREKPPLRAPKRVKRCRLSEILQSKTDLKSDNHVVKWEPTCNRVRINPIKRQVVLALPAPEPLLNVFPKLNEHIELLSQDSGMRGCWFRCKILLLSKGRLKVQYIDVSQADGARKLVEWVPASRVADPDKLGVRRVGRLTIRPRPRVDSSAGATFVVGAAVDVWWCNSWWEGVVIGYETLMNTSLQVYFPGENTFLTVARKNMRVSRDWIGGRWVNIKAREDILSFLSSIFSPSPKLPPLASFNSSAATSTHRRREEPEVDKWKAPSQTAVETPNLKKRLISRYNGEMMIKSVQ